MEQSTFNQLVFENWANYFHCPFEIVHTAGTTLNPEEKYDGDKIIAFWYIGKHTFIQCDPVFAPRLEQLLRELPEQTALSGDRLISAWGEASIASRDRGLSHYLYPPDLPNYQPSDPFTLRQLTEADAGVMSTLHSANTPEDADEGFVEVTHQIAYGCFNGEQLVAAASGYERTGFLDIGVLTHPGFRKKGLGKAAVGAICEWAAKNDMIAQYRHDTTNLSSQNVAAALNFRRFFESESISFG